MFHSNLKKIYLSIYRTVGFGVLLTALCALACYGVTILFFLFNNTWISPTVLSGTSKDMLSFSGGYEQAQQTLLTLNVTHNQAIREYEIAKKNVEALTNVSASVHAYNSDLKTLTPKRQQELQAEQEYSRQLETVKDSTQKSVKSGLITRNDAVTLMSTVTRFQAESTDDGVSWNTTNVTARATAEQVMAQLRQAESDVQTKKDMVAAIEVSLRTSQQTVYNLESSVYFKAFTNPEGSNLMFVSYDTLPNVKVGDAIYDCYLLFVACRRVGTITHIYRDEQIVDFPLYNVRLSRTVRGVMVEANMTRLESMRPTVLFAGSKPVGF